MTNNPSYGLDSLPVWERMGTILLDEMDSIKLMNRIDSKYVTDMAVLERLLEMAAQRGYRALKTEGVVISPYDSVYYDTPNLKMFSDHATRRLVRQKVRTRVYVNSGATFLEIKRKNNHGRTKKSRCSIPAEEFGDFRADSAACEYLASHSDYTATMLEPRLETRFRRITLVNSAKTERLTIDTQLEFVNFVTGQTASLGPAVIIELKQDGRAASEMKGILLELRVKPLRVSKYCIGTCLTDPSARSNRFKEKIRMINKITGYAC
ncbi:MAG: polyphosphate polymerase domain-containing protein [Bacteroidales bacterium]|nr:polyphosphate polymerase domain-containing protein [Bacteroidales bacterium]